MKVEDKSNEITAIPPLLEWLDITGSIITIDAMGTQTEIANKLIEKKGDYVLALKTNHPTLYNQVQQWFETAQTHNFHCVDVSYVKRIETGHHRREIREVGTVAVTAIAQLYQPKIWAGLQSLVMVVPVRHLWNKTTREVQFYLTCLPKILGLKPRPSRTAFYSGLC
jgi:predicted transposase YbfD/YdcC